MLTDLSSWPPSPAGSEIRAARQAAGLTQRQAGALIYSYERTWAGWERGENPMHPALWDLWRERAADPAWIARVRGAA